MTTIDIISVAKYLAATPSRLLVLSMEDALRIEVSLPWFLAKAAKRLLPILRKEATLLLEKK